MSSDSVCLDADADAGRTADRRGAFQISRLEARISLQWRVIYTIDNRQPQAPSRGYPNPGLPASTFDMYVTSVCTALRPGSGAGLLRPGGAWSLPGGVDLTACRRHTRGSCSRREDVDFFFSLTRATTRFRLSSSVRRSAGPHLAPRPCVYGARPVRSPCTAAAARATVTLRTQRACHAYRRMPTSGSLLQDTAR